MSSFIRRFKNIGHSYEAQLAGMFYGYPSKKIKTIGVTGTDGKTTTASLIFHILKEAGFKTAMITTVGAQIGDKEFETGLHTTTPSAFNIQKYIKKAADEKCDYLVLEVTSHALDQNRVKGVDFKIGVLTNVTQDHFDYHGSYDSYLDAKCKLFLNSEISVLNKDDKSYEKLDKLCAGKKVFTYSINGKSDFSLKALGLQVPSIFEFNKENFLAAASVAQILDVPREKIKSALLSFKFPAGRQEIVYDNSFRVIIDFAHTPNSFLKVLSSIKKETKGRLIHVFGSAGDRDKSKRPLMGEISAKYSDVIILTAEDPRRENIEEINRQIMLRIKDHRHAQFISAPHDLNQEVMKQAQNDRKGKYLLEIFDRQEAINFAISIAKKEDVVILTGKGHEKSMNLGKGEIEWSEHKAIEKALKASGKLSLN